MLKVRKLKRKIWFISDTHCQHGGLQVPDVDVVIHCGDESEQGTAYFNEPEAREFFDWYSDLRIPTKIFIPGNHSTAIEQGLIQKADYPAIHFLIHELIETDGLSVFGSPFTPVFFNWAYMKERSELDAIWATIPAGIDILVTHGPPKGVLDLTRDFQSHLPVHVGSKSLRKQVEERIKPRFHAFGHIHDERGINNFGEVKHGEVHYINCSCCDNANQLKNQGIVLEIEH